MELHQIRYFLAVAREQHFSRAASSCNVTQPALTRAIQKLEEEMGSLLFDRRPGRVELTELGRTLLPRFEAALAEVREARLDAKSLVEQKRRKLRLALACTLAPNAAMALIAELKAKVRDLELVIREDKARPIQDMLLRDEVDAAILGLPKYPSDFSVVPLFRERFVVALPHGHRLLKQAAVRLKELDGESYVDRLHCEFDDHFQAQHGEWPIELDVKFVSEREDWIQAMIASNFGCAIVPERLPLLPGIETRPLVDPETYRDISVVTVEGRAASAPLEELVTIARGIQRSAPPSKQ